MVLLIFLLILSILVLIHEFGHFITAKKLGVKVDEFGLGLPPRVFGKRIGETLYSLNLLPFGGFVKLEGEELTDTTNIEQEIKNPKSFVSKTPLQRSAIITAGVIMNYALAVILFYIVLMSNGFKTFYIPLLFDYKFRFGQVTQLGTVVTAMEDNSPAVTAGIQLGDALLKIDGAVVNDVTDVRKELTGKIGKEVSVEVMDVKSATNTKTRTVKAIPTLSEAGYPVLGVYLTEAVSIGYISGTQKLFAGFLHSYNIMSYSVNGFKEIIQLSFRTRDISPVASTVTGPVGIYQVVGGVLKYGGDKVLVNLLDFVALMSVSLAFINIMPFPALDGGRLVFVVIEGITKKRVNPNVEAKVHYVGMAFLLLLMLLVTVKDII